MTLAKAAPLLLAGLAAALPQGSPAPTESPTGLDCSWHLDHWDCTAPCSTITNTRLAIDATITDLPSWVESMNSAYSTSGIPFSGTRVFIHTSVYEYPGGSFTGYGVYDSHALTRAGYSVISEMVVTTSCPPSTTYSLPPSPTGSICSPHQDHWHCDPTSTGSEPSPTGECTAYDDHWHCPSGVPEPTSPSGGSNETSTGSSSAPTTTAPPSDGGECTPHDDHWHCPPGVPGPSFPPGSSNTSTGETEPTTASPGICTPHDDHWHCPPGVPGPTFPPEPNTETSTGSEPTTTSLPVGGDGECTPHDDHWHCPPGVPEPTFPPGGSTPTDTNPTPTSPPGIEEPSYPPGGTGGQGDDMTSPPNDDEDTECTIHDDHWHCPEGVEEPPHAPGGEPGVGGQSSPGSGSGSQTSSIAEPSTLPITETAGASGLSLSQASLLAGVAASVLFGFIL